jgi:hypothetical protein
MKGPGGDTGVILRCCNSVITGGGEMTKVPGWFASETLFLPLRSHTLHRIISGKKRA